MVRRVVAALVLLLFAACNRSPSEPAGGSDAGGATTPGSGTAAAGAKRITKESCTTWSAHGVEVVIADWKDAASQCAPQVRESLAAKLEGQRVSIQGGAFEVCSRHVGQGYAPEEAQCYLRANTVKGLADCGFSAMTNPDDTDLSAELDRIRSSCAPTAAPRVAPTSL
jgi:hypothetical protein